MQGHGTEFSGKSGAVIDQGASYAALPKGRLDEKPVEFDLAVLTGQYDGKTHNYSFLLGDEYLPGIKLPERQNDGIGIRQHSVSVARIIE